MVNAIPELFTKMVNLSLEQKFDEAEKIRASLLQLDELMYAESNPVGVKALMNILGFCNPYVRLPLVRASEDLENKIKAEAKKLGLIS